MRCLGAFLFQSCLLPAISFPSFCLTSAQSNDLLSEQYQTLKSHILTGSVYQLRDSLTLNLPDMQINLISGRLQYLQGNDSTTAGFIFIGQGSAYFSPRHQAERQQLRRYIDRESLQAEFDFLVFKYAASEGLPRQLERLDGIEQIDEKAVEFASGADANMLERIGFNLPSRMLTEFILQPTGFAACIFRDLRERRSFPPIYYYFHDPASFEQVQLMQHRPKALGKPFYTICRYPLGDYLAAQPEGDIRISQYNGWIKIDRNEEITADLGVDIVVGDHKLRTLYFQLSKLLKLHWITSSDGDSLRFIQEKDQTGFTLFLPEHLTPVDTLRINFHYSGSILQKRGPRNIFLKEPTLWHPRLGYLRRGRYKIIYKYPRELDLVANGQLLRKWLEGEYKLSYYFQRVPAKASMFMLGKFQRSHFHGPNRVAISLFSSSRHSKNILEAVNKDIASSLYLFSQSIMPYEYNQIAVVEAATIESQGYPGFVKLSNLAFREQSGGTLAATRSHEIAHQWWGNLVGWRSYRDQWLSESFSEYMGALYLAYHLPGENQFQQLLKAWRDDLLEGGNIGVSLGLKRFGFSKDALRNSHAEKAGPIYLGIRLGQRESAEYYLLVYEEGAYLLHTLRNYLRDDQTGSDEKFWQLLRNYASTFAGRDPATIDFIEMVSAHTGEDMNWFFDQWLLGQVIPTYSYEYDIRATADGYRIAAKVTAENVDAAFKNFVPIRIEFDDGSTRYVRTIFHGDHFSAEYGPFEHPPVRVEFNSEHAVLAREK